MCNTPIPPCIFLDRDGTVIRDAHYLSSPDGVELLPQAAPALALLHGLGCPLVLLTNQSGVGRGYYSEQDVHAVHQRLRSMLLEHGVPLDGIFFCPHSPEENCQCRKPAPGLALQAVDALPHLRLAQRLRAGRAVMIGDKACDVDTGRALGARAVLTLTGKGAQTAADYAASAAPGPDFIAPTLMDAALWVQREFFGTQGADEPYDGVDRL